MILLIDSSLVLLRPRKRSTKSRLQEGHHRRTSSSRTIKGTEEVKYDSQVLADHIESYWTHLSGIGTLENSLWGWDGEVRFLPFLFVSCLLLTLRFWSFLVEIESVAGRIDDRPGSTSSASPSEWRTQNGGFLSKDRRECQHPARFLPLMFVPFFLPPPQKKEKHTNRSVL